MPTDSSRSVTALTVRPRRSVDETSRAVSSIWNDCARTALECRRQLAIIEEQREFLRSLSDASGQLRVEEEPISDPKAETTAKAPI